MTIGDYIQEKFAQWAVEYSANLAAYELSRMGLDSAETMTDQINLDRFFYNVIPDILLRPKQISEGGFSITYDTDGLAKYYGIVADRLGMVNRITGNTITDISNRW